MNTYRVTVEQDVVNTSITVFNIDANSIKEAIELYEQYHKGMLPVQDMTRIRYLEEDLKQKFEKEPVVTNITDDIPDVFGYVPSRCLRCGNEIGDNSYTTNDGLVICEVCHSLDTVNQEITTF